jgi:hypothetical protein
VIPNEISPITICTLWEKDYHKGLGTFVNSLVRAGYRGRIWAGYRGVLPAWAAVGRLENERYILSPTEGVELVLCKLHVDIHFAQYKASWMMRVLTELEPSAQGIYYFDPDIFVLARWSFFEQWTRYGIAVCEDQSYPINPTHPLVRSWQEYAGNLGYPQWRPPDVYPNSGLLGLTRDCQSFLTEWQNLINAMQRDFGLRNVLKTGTRSEIFHQTDQDALAVATAISSHLISWVGLDGMGFGRGEWLTLHALVKPWRRRVFRDLLVEGHRPDAALRLYWTLAEGPIQVEPPSRVSRHRLYIPVAAFLARFYSRR